MTLFVTPPKRLAAIWLAVAFFCGALADRLWLAGDLVAEATVLPEPALHALAPSSRYVCPMHAHITDNAPGSCPVCGMDLVAAEAETEHLDPGLPAVQIDPAVVNNLGVRTAAVERGTLTRQIDTMGMISKISSTRNLDVTPGLPGRLTWISDKRVGDIVEAGETLYRVYVPERIQAQKEYLASWSAGDHALIPAMWDALRALKFDDAAIKRLEDSGQIEEHYAVTAARRAAVVSRLGEVGTRVKPGARVFTLGGNFRIDLNAEIFERHWGWVAFRQRAQISIPSVRGGRFEGMVQTINNSVNYKTRALTANLAFNTLNPGLREGMVADVRIFAAPRNDVLYVPRDAVILSADGARVVLAEGAGRFRPRAVETGIESGDRLEIVAGLEEGEQVVVSGQFLIDSESSLSASLRRIERAEPAP